MIYAIKHNKVNRAIFKANEDALTSSIFERLMYLPKELLHHVFETSLYDEIPHLNLQQIQSITYWPSWNSDNTSNISRVEPDIFIRNLTHDVIVEAKRNDSKQQSQQQWENEIKAYYNEYAEDNKPLVFIALGGIHTKKTTMISVLGVDHSIYMCTWKSILNTIQNIIHDMELATNYTNNNIAINKILKDMVLCFELFGFSTSLWLERFIKAPKIQQQSINYYSTIWTN
jgi:hypothetical protein